MTDLEAYYRFPPEVELFPVTALDPAIRLRFECKDEEFVLSKRDSRLRSKVIPVELIPLMNEFYNRRRLFEAVISAADKVGLEAAAYFDAVASAIVGMIEQGYLVECGIVERKFPEQQIVVGILIDNKWMVRRVLQRLDDSTTCLLTDASGQPFFAKLHSLSGEDNSSGLKHEYNVLCNLPNGIAPAPIEFFTDGLKAGLVTNWLSGKTLQDWLKEARSGTERLKAALDVLRVYCRLHESGHLHGDVHPRNVMIGEDGSISLVDFGSACKVGERSKRRAGVAYYYDPELAAAVLGRRRSPRPTCGAEQYSIAALLFWLISGGQTYVDFRVDKESLLKQVVSGQPSTLGPPLAGLINDVVSRALSKKVEDRYPSTSLFLKSLEDAVEVHFSSISTSPAAPRRLGKNLERCHQRYGDLFAIEPASMYRTLREAPPFATIQHGTAGLALAMVRYTTASKAQMLGAADLLLEMSAEDLDASEAFSNPILPITKREVGEVSVFHGAPGFYAVRAALASQRGDVAVFDASVSEFLGAQGGRCKGFDLTLGWSGILLIARHLLEAGAALPVTTRRLLLENIRHVANQVMCSTNFGVSAWKKQGSYNGAAHGPAGILYALVACKDFLDERQVLLLEQVLSDYSTCIRTNRTAWWTMKQGGSRTDLSWCNGAAGHLMLWSSVAMVFPASSFEDHVFIASREIIAGFSGGNGSLCCGAAGQAYALWGAYRLTGERAFADAGMRLLERAVAEVVDNDLSLYRGFSGVASLLADVMEGGVAIRMPVIESII